MANRTLVMVGAALGVVVAGAIAVAIANDWGGWSGKDRARSGRGGSYGASRLIQYDTDRDGRITRAEIDAGLQAEFNSADANGDGKLDAAEFQKYNDARRAERKARYEAWRAAHPNEPERRRYSDRSGRDGFDPMKYTDWNRDGVISPDEFGGRVRNQAMRADRDNDGVVLVEDLKRNRDKRGGNEAGQQ